MSVERPRPLSESFSRLNNTASVHTQEEPVAAQGGPISSVSSDEDDCLYCRRSSFLSLEMNEQHGLSRKGASADTISNREEQCRLDKRNTWLRRKLAGVRLTCCLIILILYLPFLLAGFLLFFIANLLIVPARLLGQYSLPEFVRLFYIHRVGKLHLFLSWQWRKREVATTSAAAHLHSRSVRVDTRMESGLLISIHTIAQLRDNFAYLVVNRGELNPSNYRAVLIDCADAQGCVSAISSISNIHYSGRKISVEGILTTHHHWDHQAGNELIRQILPEIKDIYGSVKDRVLGKTVNLKDGEQFELAGMTFDAISVPCHTRGSLVYKLRGMNSRDFLFLGDTLFLGGGCGAPFEGTEDEMHGNFARLLLGHHPDSLLFPGHEFTERIMQEALSSRAAELTRGSPLRFFALCTAFCRVRHLRSLKFPAPTVPIRLVDEAKYNPHFEPVLKAIYLLKRALWIHTAFSYQHIHTKWNQKKVNEEKENPLRQDTTHLGSMKSALSLGQSDTSAKEMLTPTSRATEAPGRPLKRIRPKLAWDEHGEEVIVEPPWITKMVNYESSPWSILWTADLRELVHALEMGTISRTAILERLSRLLMEGVSGNAGKQSGALSRRSCCLNELAGIERYSSVKRDRTTVDKIIKCLCSPFAGAHEDWIPTSIIEQILLTTIVDNESALAEFATMSISLDSFQECVKQGCLKETHYRGQPGFRLEQIVEFVLRNFHPAQVIDRCRSEEGSAKRMKRNALASQSIREEEPHEGREDHTALPEGPVSSTLGPTGSILGNCTKHACFDDEFILHDFTTCRICAAEPIDGVPKRPTLVHKETCRSRERPELSTVITAAEEQLNPTPSKLSSQIQRQPTSFGILLPAFGQSDRRKNSDMGSNRLMTLRRISSIPLDGGTVVDELNSASPLPSVKTLLGHENAQTKNFIGAASDSGADWGLLQLPKVRESQRMSFPGR